MPFEITRTELVWPGKYDEHGKRPPVEQAKLPFQVIERVNESRATREAEKTRNPTLFDIWEGDPAETFEDGWRNKLIWGDNKLVMSSLLDQFAGKVDLIYIDPPFATGADFSMEVAVGERIETLFKEQSLIEEKAYRDTWGRGLASYLGMMMDRLVLARDLLVPSGSIYLHCDYRVESALRMVLDDIFGQDCLANIISWCYTGPGNFRNWYPRRHDTLLFYTRSVTRQGRHCFNGDAIRVRTTQHSQGRTSWAENWDPDLQDEKGKLPEDWWPDISPVGRIRRELLGYPTQKPEKLLQRVIAASSSPGQLVADFFCGSGTTLAVAEKLGRRWIGADLGRYAVHTTRKRLLGIPGCKPFEVLNLGKYERRYWQVATFGEDLDQDGVITLYEYIAFILKLYGASPAAGMEHLHGRVGSAFVHVGAVDSPVTIDEITSCVEECVALHGKELHVLGWEWEMGLHDPMTDQAAASGVRLVLRQIPREVMEQQAVDRGDVAFFELAYLDVEVKPASTKRKVVAKLNNFMIPSPELVPDDVRAKITKWSDYVDYWAVDWNFSDDTFMQGWVTYRTRKDRSLDLESDPHTYEERGEYAVMVKVIDIFGNDTSTIVRVKVD